MIRTIYRAYCKTRNFSYVTTLKLSDTWLWKVSHSFGIGFSKEPQDCIRELFLRGVMSVVRHMLVHDRP